MTGRARRRLSHTLTGLATLTFPKARRSDARVVRDCAREAVDATSLRALPRESLSLATAGMRTRIGLAASELWHAPWRDALAVLALPLAATLLLVWTFGFIPRYDHWPLGEGWALLLGGSLVAVIGAALERGRLTAAGALAVFVAAASPYLGYGTESRGVQPHAELLPRLGSRHRRRFAPSHPAARCGRAEPSARSAPAAERSSLVRLAAGLVPAIVAAIYLLPGAGSASRPTWARLRRARTDRMPERLVLGPPYPCPGSGLAAAARRPRDRPGSWRSS